MVQVGALSRSAFVRKAEGRVAISGAIVLAGGLRMIPLPDRPLVEYTPGYLSDRGVKKAMFAVSAESGFLEKIKDINEKNGRNPDISFHTDGKPGGTAGILKGVNGFMGDDSFPVMNCSAYPGNFNLKEAVASRARQRSPVTVIVKKAFRGASRALENVLDRLSFGAYQALKRDGGVQEDRFLH